MILVSQMSCGTIPSLQHLTQMSWAWLTISVQVCSHCLVLSRIHCTNVFTQFSSNWFAIQVIHQRILDVKCIINNNILCKIQNGMLSYSLKTDLVFPLSAASWIQALAFNHNSVGYFLDVLQKVFSLRI